MIGVLTMSTTQEKIAQLEDDAKKLVQNLETLYVKAGSYNTAKDELQKVNSELLKLINETKTLGDESHKIISKINEIGSSQIFKMLGQIDKNISSFREESLLQFKSNKNITIITLIVLIIILILNVIIYLK